MPLKATFDASLPKSEHLIYMVDSIEKKINTTQQAFPFSILIPSWNNLSYLQLCISSIQKNSKRQAQIIVCINEGKDQTRNWIESEGNIDYVYSPSNLGICYGLNLCRTLVKSDYIVYMNDDMYVLPGWDEKLFADVKMVDTKLFMFSSTMVEPHDTGNPCVIVKDYGTSIESFEENRLLHETEGMSIEHWSGSTWPPNLVHVDLWDMVGGMSMEFSPGMYSDPDLSMKCYEAGVRIFKGVGDSLVYHFGSKSTKRVKKNKGKDQFLRKWQMSARYFTHVILRRGTVYAKLPENHRMTVSQRLLQKIKILKCWI